VPARFFSGHVRLLFKRCEILRSRISSMSHLPEELRSYKLNLDEELRSLGENIKSLLEDPDFGAPCLVRNQIGDYRRLSEHARIIEGYLVTVLERFSDRDRYLHLFVQLFCRQAHFPFDPPLVSSYSAEYFWTFPPANVIFVPACEEHFLLAIPDLVHELGHLFLEQGAPDLMEESFNRTVTAHMEGMARQFDDDPSADAYRKNFDMLEYMWTQKFVAEFFADMFATYVVGPAYGWSHLRLVMQSGEGIYSPGFGDDQASHPSDEARMRGILFILEQMGELQERQSLSDQWDRYVNVTASTPDEEYANCYPDVLLRDLARRVVELCQGCDVVPFDRQPDALDNLPALLRQAWGRFRSDPDRYPEWESATVASVKLLVDGVAQPLDLTAREST